MSVIRLSNNDCILPQSVGVMDWGDMWGKKNVTYMEVYIDCLGLRWMVSEPEAKTEMSPGYIISFNTPPHCCNDVLSQCSNIPNKDMNFSCLGWGRAFVSISAGMSAVGKYLNVTSLVFIWSWV